MSERYPDFADPAQPNTVWTWIKGEDGTWSYQKRWLNNLTGGDTDSCFINLARVFDDDLEDKDLAVDVSDAIGQEVNSTFPDYVKFAFNAPDSRSDVIQTDREVVSDKSLFLSKKRYIMHVINNEGDPCDKLKIVGVELKKSDVSKAVKDLLMEIVQQALAGATKEQLRDSAKNMRKKFLSYDVRDRARPISCKGLKKYEDALAMGKVKNIPYQVKAAMFYNSMCENTDKKIRAGDKIGVFNIVHPTENYIAFPIDINTMPAFMDTIIPNDKALWQAAKKKIDSYMSSMGWDTKSMKKQTARDLFQIEVSK